MRHSTLLTEFTDISQRLEYLVAHSSQLVFITGEDASVQKGFVEAFLGQQSHSANVAFLSAKRGKNNQFYRQQLAEQLSLLSSRNQSFVQAFAARDDKVQPVIIAITCAENMPEEVLRELWDLVLQNRFARNGEQVNILMFGEHEWAEEVKSWLPTNNNDKPVLLTTQTLEYDEETEVEGDLDDMIANRRKLFQQRMQARAFSEGANVSLLTTWWFKLALAAIFLVSFSSILIWQYFDVSKSALQEFSHFLFQEQSATESTDAQGNVQIETAVNGLDATGNDDSNQRVAANFNAAMESLGEMQGQNSEQGTTQETAQETVTVNSFSQQSADSGNSEYIADISAEQLKQLRDSGSITAVSDSSTQSKATNLANQVLAGVSASANAASTSENPTTETQSLQSSILDALNELDSLGYEDQQSAPVDQLPASEQLSSSQQQSGQLQTTQNIVSAQGEDNASTANIQNNDFTETANTVNDFAVEDVATTNQSAKLDTTTAAPGSVSIQNSAAQDNFDQGNSVQDSVIQDIVPEEIPGFRYHEPVLLELPNDSYVLQISGITTEGLLEEFLVDNRLLNNVWVYKTQRYGGDWFVVLLNQSFDSLPQARNSVSLLSDELQAVEPFAKSVAAIRNEILQDGN